MANGRSHPHPLANFLGKEFKKEHFFKILQGYFSSLLCGSEMWAAGRSSLGAARVEGDQRPLALPVAIAEEGFAVLVRADHDGTGRRYFD